MCVCVSCVCVCVCRVCVCVCRVCVCVYVSCVCVCAEWCFCCKHRTPAFWVISEKISTVPFVKKPFAITSTKIIIHTHTPLSHYCKQPHPHAGNSWSFFFQTKAPTTPNLHPDMSSNLPKRKQLQATIHNLGVKDFWPVWLQKQLRKNISDIPTWSLQKRMRKKIRRVYVHLHYERKCEWNALIFTCKQSFPWG